MCHPKEVHYVSCLVDILREGEGQSVGTIYTGLLNHLYLGVWLYWAKSYKIILLNLLIMFNLSQIKYMALTEYEQKHFPCLF